MQLITELINEKLDYVNGITTCRYLLFSKVTFRVFHESAPARSSNILFWWNTDPPNSRTPLPSGDSAIAPPLTL